MWSGFSRYRSVKFRPSVQIPTLPCKIGSCSISVELMCLKTMMGDEAASFERWCSHRRWWIIQAASANTLWAGFFVSGQSGQAILPWREAPFDFFCWHIQQPPTACLCNRIWLVIISGGNWRQGAREHLARRPSSMCCPSCHGRGSLPVALRHQFAPPPWRLRECHSQCVVRTHKVVIGSPPFQVCKQMWGLLSRRPGAACERCHAMSDSQIHPLNESRVQPPREA